MLYVELDPISLYSSPISGEYLQYHVKMSLP